MDIKELEYFKVVCEQKSITKAAGYLYMSQQGLSKIIKNIERELDTTLLTRKASGIELTQTGKYLYSKIPGLLKDYLAICNEIICIEQSQHHEIKLLVNKNHPLSQRESVTIRDLEGERMYLESTEFNINELIVKKCRQEGFEPHIAFETSGFSLCHKMVQQNKGISVTVDFIFDDMTDSNLVMIPFADGPYYWITSMLTREGSVVNEDAELFGRHVLKWQKDIQNKHIQR